MEIDPTRKISLGIQHMVQLINQDLGYLHSLTVAARMHDLAYAPQTQASLEEILVAMQTDLRKVLEVFDAHVKEALDRRIAILQQTRDTDESMENISNPGSPVKASTPILEDSDDGIS